MNNIRSTLATVWRIAMPYFRSEDKWAGRGLLAAVVSIELALVGIDVLLNQWRNRFYNALQEKDWDGFVTRDRRLRRAGDRRGRACDLPALPQSVASDPLAALDDHAISRRWLQGANHYRMQLARRRGRQPGSAHQRRREAVRRTDADDRRGAVEFDRDAGILRHHPLGPVRSGAAVCCSAATCRSPAIWCGAH